MIESNVSNTTSTQPGRWLARRRLLLALIAVSCVLILALLVSGVGARVIDNITLAAGGQSWQLQGLTGQTKSSERVYLVSWVQPNDPYGAETGRLRVLNPITGELVKVIDTGYGPDIAVSPDGLRLYLAALEPGAGDVPDDYLTAFDTATWTVTWKTKISRSTSKDWRRVQYIGGDGPSAIEVWPDGSKLLIYEYAGHSSRITLVDTTSGQVLGESTPISYCDTADLALAPDSQWLYISCYGSNDVRFMNASTLQVEETLTIPGAHFASGPNVPPYTPIRDIPGAMASSVLSPDGRWLYVLTDEPRLALVNLEKRSIERWVDVGNQGYSAVQLGLVDLSQDGSRLFVGLRTKEPASTVDEIRIFDTESWTRLGQVNLENLDGGLSQIGAPMLQNRLLLRIQNDHYHDGFLHTHTSLLALDLTHPGAVSTLVDLSKDEHERLIRFVVAP